MQVSSVVCDLPFIVRGYGKEINAGQLVERFNYFSDADEAYQANLDMISLAYRKLKRGGYSVHIPMHTIKPRVFAICGGKTRGLSLIVGQML